MLHLVTGVPGAGKTLNTIKAVTENKDYEGRPVFYHGIKDLKRPDWHELDDDEAKDWMSLPNGAIVIYDEAQGIFPQRSYTKEVPEHIAALNTHRHGGYDIYLITQHPKLVDVNARRLVGLHQHYDRRFGQRRINRFTWQKAGDPGDYHSKQEAVSDSVVLDKKYFGQYHSAEIHTHKRRYPLKVVAAVGFFACLPVVYWFGISQLNLPDQDEPELLDLDVSSDALADLLPGTGNGLGQVVSGNPWIAYIPRIEGLPHTAPIYDELTKPVAYPRYQCMYRSSRRQDCRCYTQQATRLDIPIATCLEIVDRGLFDPALPDLDSRESQRGTEADRHRRAPARVPSAPAIPNRVIINHAPGGLRS